MEEIREELHRIVDSSTLWDGKVWNLQVTEAAESSAALEFEALTPFG